MAIAILLFTYCFLAFDKLPFLRLDRTSGVLVGAVAMVAFGVLGFDEAWKAIDSQTIVLLMGMMILNVSWKKGDLFQHPVVLRVVSCRKDLKEVLAGC